MNIKSSLSPKLRKKIQEDAKKYKYDSKTDPFMIEFRKKMKEIDQEYDYKYYNKPTNFGFLLMVLFIAMIFAMLLQ